MILILIDSGNVPVVLLKISCSLGLGANESSFLIFSESLPTGGTRHQQKKGSSGRFCSWIFEMIHVILFSSFQSWFSVFFSFLAFYS